MINQSVIESASQSVVSQRSSCMYVCLYACVCIYAFCYEHDFVSEKYDLSSIQIINNTVIIILE